jgi:hypothetical protein
MLIAAQMRVNAMRHLSCILALVLPIALSAQTQVAPDPPTREWKASWITHPTAPLREPVVLHFRHTLSLATVPASYIVRVSADNRFILEVNGHRVGDGPARGDLTHWRYERFDLAPFLQAGENLVTATVWNFGVYAPIAQMTDRTAFLLEGEATGDASISTPKGWLVEVEPGHTVVPRVVDGFWDYMASGTGEQIDASKYDWDWKSPAATGSSWVPAASPIRESIYATVNQAHSAEVTGDNPWGLIPDPLPPQEYSPTAAGQIVQSEMPGGSILGPLPTFDPPSTLLANSHYHLLLDRKRLTTAYPRLVVSGGKGSKIRITYAEALYDKQGHKGDRDEFKGRTAHGMHDSFLPDGGQHRVFEPLWWRTWRYLDIDIETADEPLQLESLTANFTAYPFVERASFHSTDPELDKIWEISWRTARVNAHETYMDAPYYEQLQYVGDTRVQALISYAVSGDDRLGRQALSAFDESRLPEGITRSRYPSSLPQNIPTFSLLWIGMLHDYWMYRPDPEPVRSALPGTRTVLTWFAQHEAPDGLLHELPWWSFIDWVQDGQTIPTYAANGESCMTTLEYLGALGEAADIERAYGDPILAARYLIRADHVRSGLQGKCWSAPRKLIADTPELKGFSQQANILAVLYDVIPRAQQKEVLKRMLAIEPGTTPDGILSASYYFRFYLARALDHACLADEYLPSIDSWRKMLALHFSTWPEVPGETRSDSHAWSAHPIYDMLTLVAGIEPAAPGFKTVRIAPHLGPVPSLTATFPHPQGEIKVDYSMAPPHPDPDPNMKGGIAFHADITLPGTLTGTFEYNGVSRPLKPGQNHIAIPMK